MYGSPEISRDLNLAFEMPSGESQMEETAKSSSSSSSMLYCSLPGDQFLLSQEIRPGNLNSSATGLFSELTLEHGDALVRNLFGQWTGSAVEAAPSESRRSKNRTITPTRQPRTLDSISHISEIPGLHLSSWNDHSLLSDSFGNFSGRGSDPQELQNSESGIHFSSPKTSQEMASMLQFQEAVPCKIRAKRGCATHPRSIAERERRTRISERIKKLQELVPKMDKQLSTAEMLDMALDYIKDLQEQVKNLSKNKAECSCLGNNGG